MSGFQYYNSSGALTIDSTNKSIGISAYKGNPGLMDVGSVVFAGGSAMGNGTALGWLPLNFFPANGMRWWRPLTDGGWGMCGGGLFTPNSGDFMLTSPNNGIASGYLDVFDASGNLVWSAASAGTMPRVMDFFTVPNTHDLSNAINLNSSFANPWICISQCPGNSSEAGEGQGGYSGLLIRRNSPTNFTLQYIARRQKTYYQAMGSNGIRIALASFTGY